MEDSLKRWLSVVVVLLAAEGFRGPTRRLEVRMGAIGAGSSVVVAGNGPVFLLAAKTAASLGYETTIVSNQDTLYRSLLWGDEEPSPKLKMLGVTSDEDVEAFNKAVSSADGVVICYDRAEQGLTDNLLKVIMPVTERNRRVCLLSRHLNGKGNGALCAAAKASANADVWVASPATVDLCKSIESKVKAQAAESTATDVVVVRCGTLKGGGPGDAQAVEAKGPDAPASLTYGFYRQGQQDLVNWRLLFDCDTNGAKLLPGDTAEGPGWKAIFAATSPDAEKGDSGRGAVAQALIRALAIPDLAGRDFSVETRQSRLAPTDAEWDALFAAVLP